MKSQIAKMNFAKPAPIEITDRKWPDTEITESPIWCAVDLRDGNQALPNPMSPEQKLRYFKTLLKIGFKEIEVGFPSASSDDFEFVRKLIDDDLIPDDVCISVLTQARSHLIEKTVESIRGAKNAMIHFYIATSELHRQFVIGGTEDEQIEIARDATQQIKDGVSDFPDKVRLEFSPEEFTDSDLDYVVKVCDTVVETWGPEGDEKVVLNLPATVERRFPNEYADMIEEFMKRQKFSDQTIVSLHAHNDMGMGIASTMLSLKAGAQRVEGTLFGHGERTGNVDLIICALDLDYLGIDTGLSFDNLPQIANLVEEVTDIKIHPRHPYSGELVFTAFSGSHQDAINKGYNQKEELAEHFKGWKIPYLHIDPLSLGRSFEKFIRINSQSGKGGIAYILSQEFHINLPRWAQVDFASKVQVFADEVQRELAAEELFTLFKKAYMQDDAPILLQNYWPVPSQEDPAIILGRVKVEYKGEDHELNAEGNGPISAFVHAIKQLEGVDDFVLEDFSEGTRGKTADAEAVSFVRLKHTDGKHSFIGAGIGSNIDQAAVRAVCNALNALLKF